MENLSQTSQSVPRLSDWMTIGEVSSALGISRQWVHMRITSGAFTTVHRVGPDHRPTYLISADEVNRIKETPPLSKRGREPSGASKQRAMERQLPRDLTARLLGFTDPPQG
jgi:hypothetical protein